MSLNQTPENLTLADEQPSEASSERKPPRPDKKKGKLGGLLHSLGNRVDELVQVNDELAQTINSPEKYEQYGGGAGLEDSLPQIPSQEEGTESVLSYRLSSLLDFLRQVHGFEECGVFLLGEGSVGPKRLVLSAGPTGCENLQEFEDEVDTQWERGNIAGAVREKRRMILPAQKDGNFLVIPFKVLNKRDGFWAAYFRGSTLPKKQSYAELLSVTELISSCVENYYLRQSSLSPRRERPEHVETGKLFSTVRVSRAMVHEINNSLQIILGRTQLLRMSERKSPKTPSNVRKLQTIEDNANGICGILKDFSDYLHRQFETTADEGEVNICHVLKSDLVLIKYILGSKGIKVELDADVDLPAVHGNAGELEQAFLSLIWEIEDLLVSGGSMRLQMSAEEELLCLNISCVGEEGCEDRWPDLADLQADARFRTVYQILEKNLGELKTERPEDQKIEFSLRLPIPRGTERNRRRSPKGKS